MSIWGRRLALGVGLWVIFVANGREIGAGDTIPAILLPIAIARGDGFTLDRFEPVISSGDAAATGTGESLPYFAARKRGRLVSRYPVAPVVVALPFTLPQIALLDRWRPGWDATPVGALRYGRWIAKNAAAAVVALAAVLLCQALRAFGLARVALPATLVAALGSPLWTIAAQSPWQHGTGVLALTTAILLLRSAPGRSRALATGLALAVLVAARLPDIVFALPLAGWALLRRPREAPWLAAGPLVVGSLLAGYNLGWFGTLLGGQVEIEAVRLPMQGLPATWGNPLVGAAGTLFSPNRGLLVFCPWVATAAVVALPTLRARFGAGSMAWPLLLGLCGHFAVVASYSNWWGGWCFGPRYWTEAVPVLAMLLAVALEDARTRGAAVRVAVYGTAAYAIVLQGIGALYYPSSWNATPLPTGQHHERLWDWSDSEITRGLREGPHRAECPLRP